MKRKKSHFSKGNTGNNTHFSKEKTKSNAHFSNEKDLRSILDKEYFHVYEEFDPKSNRAKWKIYFKNLSQKQYLSKKNMALLDSNQNTVNDIYRLRDKFEIEKSKIALDNISELLNITNNVFNNLNKLQNYFAHAMTIIMLCIIMAICVNIVFFNNLGFSLLTLLLTIVIGIADVGQQEKLYKERSKCLKRIKEDYIKEKIKRQGLYFVKRLKNDV